jgi:anti-anti-sigma regulatory factor
MFVRNPTTNWSDLDQMDVATPDSAFSKQALKEMIERKRQNDFVRKREFDQLRKLRKRSAADLSAEVGRPSFFHSSLSSSTDDRASTLKKIDEIEAHMSKQWWKGRQEDETPTPRAVALPTTKGPSVGMENAPETIAPEPRTSHYAVTEAGSPGARLNQQGAREFTDTLPSNAPSIGPIPSQNSRSLDSRQNPVSVARSPNSEIRGAGFSSSKLYAGESDDAGTDPELEEAAIRFANGDDTGAEAGLLSALRTDPIDRESADLWASALFDLYRATGQQIKFDGVAVELAERFGRSAPAWFSIRDLAGRTPDPLEFASPQLGPDPVTWKSPAYFTAACAEELRLALANGVSPWHLDWSLLMRIQPEAVILLGRLFATWCSQPVELCFSGAHALKKVLRPLTISGARGGDPSLWRLRMDVLRVMRLQDEFELVALDFCVTYEVSPPAWQLPQCTYSESDADLRGHEGVIRSDDQVLIPGAMVSVGYAMTVPGSLNGLPVPVPGPVLVEMVGELRGDVTAVLERLEESRLSAQRLVVSCSKLIRVDFAAAGTILNWVAACESEGCQVQFRDMHRLVATFFNVIGIHEHASVIRRMT